MFIPVPVQPPVAAGIDQVITDLHLEDIEPSGALAAGRQPRAPETVQPETVPQRQRQPAGAPLARIAQFQFVELDLHDIAIQHRRGPVLGKQRHLLQRRAAAENLDRAAPLGALAVVDLAEIEKLALDHTAATDPGALDDTPVAVLLAVLESLLAAHEHARIVGISEKLIKGVGRHYTPTQEVKAQKTNAIRAPNGPN